MLHTGPTSTGNLIDLSKFPVTFRTENVMLHKLFKKYNYELRIAGGAVRDILLGISPHDIDYATDATPTEMNAMFTSEEIRTLNRNGEAHGTVTVRINDKVNFEITTLRIDVEPDGRHTKVVFTDDWRLDAGRRDLTVNSMFLSLDLDSLPTEDIDTHLNNQDGSVTPTLPSNNDQMQQCGPEQRVMGRLYDFFGGQADLEERRIRFVGGPVDRIMEDYLRILRYFRFHGRLVESPKPDTHDPAILRAITDNAQGLGRIAGERCWSEFRRILLYPSTPSLLQHMAIVGILPHLGLSHLEPKDLSELDALWSRDILSRNPNPATCLAALLSSKEQVETVTSRLHLSNLEVFILAHVLQYRETDSLIPADLRLKHFQKRLLLSKEAPNKLRPVLTELMYYLWGSASRELVDSWSSWIPPKFPVTGYLIQQQWCLPNRAMSHVLLALRRLWVESDCQLTAEELVTESNRDAIVTEQLMTSSTVNSHGESSKRARH